MVNAQEYLDKHYPLTGRFDIKELNIRFKNLTGSLDVSDFFDLQKLNCSYNNLTNLILPNSSKLTEISCNNNNLTTLTINNHSLLQELKCHHNSLTTLTVINNVSLTELDCSFCQLTTLNLTNNLKLAELCCHYNQLNNWNYLTTCHNENSLISLNIHNNKLTGDLAELTIILNKFTKLEGLILNDNPLTGELVSLSNLTNLQLLGLYNLNLTGSSQSLQGFSKLKRLWIKNTNLIGLEYLPESLKEIYCDGTKWEEELKDYKDKKWNYYDYQAWRKDHQDLIKKAQTEKETLLNLKNLSLTSVEEQTLQELKITDLINSEKETKPTILLFTQKNTTKPTLERLIGKGGYGEVYYGKWNLQDVAVKKLYLSLNNISATDLKNIEKEIKIIQNLRNRYIIQYYDIYSENKEVFIIMDYAEQGTLTKFINNCQGQAQDWNINTKFIKQLVQGLFYIHNENIIHCDLKSLNILLTNNYDIKITDFGLSKAKIISSTHSNHKVSGSLRWMAPEIFKGQKHSKQSDIYSLGMVIWEISAQCTIPFKDLDQNSVMINLFNNGKETIPVNVPSPIREIITRCWNDEPSQRISLEEIWELVESQELQSQIEIPPK